MVSHLASLSIAWAWAVVTGSLGLNALIKSNQEKSDLRKAVGPSVVLNIDTNDVFSAGTSATAAATFISVIALLFATPIIMRKFPSSRMLRLEAAVLIFSAVWLIASMIPFTLFFATRSAHVTAKVGSVVVPQQVIQQTQQKLGKTPVYSKKMYLRLFAIIPWIAVLSTCFAAFRSYTAADDADDHRNARVSSGWQTAEKGNGKNVTVGQAEL